MGSPVSPLAFEQQMEKHWVETLGNSSSEQLRGVWRQLGSAFGEAIISHGKPDGRTWRVLQPPTGTGKTQGLCVYAAMLASQNATLEDAEKTGMLIVTQLISQCDEVVERVNGMAGTEVALASHSKNRPHALSIASSPILVITHQAFINAVKGHVEAIASKWSDYTVWRHGQRELIVIDEALSNMVEESQVKSSSISQTLGLIPEQTKLTYRSQVSALESVDNIFKRASQVISKNPNSGLTSTRMAWRGSMEMPSSLKMDGLRAELWNHTYDKSVLGKESIPDRHRLRDKVDETLRSVEAVMANWGYYAKVGDENTLNFAHLLIPDDLPGAVVMDATATQNFLWRLYEKKVQVYPVPADARSYQNVTLHIARSKVDLSRFRAAPSARLSDLSFEGDRAFPAQC